MLTQERKALILATLRQDGRVVAKSLSQALNLSEDTIRRDLRELAAEGRLQRVHGGALPASPALADFPGRLTLARDAKAILAQAAAAMIQPGQIVFLDGGTTAVQIARRLAPDLAATIVTHSPSVAVELAAHPAVTVELIGGRLFKHSVVALGVAALEAIGRIRADLFIMGVTGAHPELGFTTGDLEEAAIKRAISRQAAETMVLVTQDKLGAVSPYQILPPSAVTTLIAESGADPDRLDSFRAAGVNLVAIPVSPAPAP